MIYYRNKEAQLGKKVDIGTAIKYYGMAAKKGFVPAQIKINKLRQQNIFQVNGDFGFNPL